MWPDLIKKSKDGGLDVIETYVFWSGHEPEKNKVGSVFCVFFFFWNSWSFSEFLGIFAV